MRFYLEGPGGIPGLKQASDPRTAKNFTFEGNLTVLGTLASGAESVTSEVITVASANAFAVGANGVTNPVLNVDTSNASVATGLNVKGAAAAAGVALSVLSSGTNENLTLDAKGSGTLTLQGTATGALLVGSSTVITSASTNALAVGPNGSTNPGLKVDASTGSATSGIKITGNASGSVAVTVIDSGANSDLYLDNKGSGFLFLGQNAGATSSIAIKRKTGIYDTSANALAVGPSGPTNPVFNVDDSTASAVAGLNVKGAATGGTVAVTTTDSGSNTSLSIAAKGTGTIAFNPAVVATAGGASNDGLTFGSLGVGLFTGTGAPSFSAMNGSIYVDSNATTTTTRIYVNKSGAGTAGTTWTALTTAA